MINSLDHESHLSDLRKTRAPENMGLI
jgi:hypothetical protein